MLILDFPREDRCSGRRLGRRRRARLRQRGADDRRARRGRRDACREHAGGAGGAAFMAEGIAPLCGIDEALAAAEAAAFIGESVAEPRRSRRPILSRTALTPANSRRLGTLLDEAEAKAGASPASDCDGAEIGRGRASAARRRSAAARSAWLSGRR